jgi:hypothetical protein
MSTKKPPIPKEYLGAFKAGHRHRSREFIDEELSYELLNKILDEDCEESKKQLAYITKFNNEYHKKVIKKGDETALHNSPEHRKDLSSVDNARNRDIASIHRASLVSFDEQLGENDEGSPMLYEEFMNKSRNLNHEDTLI